ncbi:prolipoprotein diacylglyceryl transferase [Trueperella sp. LYQ143]|uniref:prolipoprotein diacylglyceryl transferase n=1 Tax=Trueperella sp. LYQ143 TaxID=3391059 RepID=UPI0039830CE3
MMFQALPSPPIHEITVGPLSLRFYALVIILGIIIATFWADRRYRKKGGPQNVVVDVAVWMVLWGIVGARIYHVITTPDPYFGPGGEPIRAFYVWQGGIGIWGAVAGGALAGYITMRRRGLRFSPLGDAVVPGLLLAQAIGRFGNWFNQELFGRPTDLPWGLRIDAVHLPAGYSPGTTFHPTFLYESLWCLAAVLVILTLEKKFHLCGGQLVYVYIALYTLGRVWIENLRIDTAHIFWGLRLNVWVSILVFCAAVIGLVCRTRYLRQHPQAKGIYLRQAAENQKQTMADELLEDDEVSDAESDVETEIDGKEIAGNSALSTGNAGDDRDETKH